MTTTIPALVKRTEAAGSKLADLLAEGGFDSIGHMRWHYVGNIDNDDRVTCTDYAESTGVSVQAVSKSARKYADANGLTYETVRKGRPQGSTSTPTDEGGADDDHHDENVVSVSEHHRTKAGDVTALAKAVRDAAKKLAKAVEKNGRPDSERFSRYVSETYLIASDLLDDEAGAVVDAAGRVLAAA